MAPLTTSEIIAQADYLTDEFDPKSLTVPQLLGVFSYHGIRYPANAKKTALVALFEKRITGNIDELREQRMVLDGSQASDRGITDGISGKQINDPDTPPQPRRSSRRSSAKPSTEPQEEAPKSRRTSAGPSTRRAPSRGRRAAPEPEIIEVSESDSEEEAPPMRPVRKNTKGKATESKPKRTSSKFGDDSGWEDNNVFQSGPDDSPPSKPAPRRSSLNPRTSRGGRRAASGSSPPRAESPETRSRSSSRPRQIPVTPSSEPVRRSSRRFGALLTPSSEPDPPEASEESDVVEESEDEAHDALEQANEQAENNNAVSQRIADISSSGNTVARRVERPPRNFGSFSQLFLALVAVAVLTNMGIYKVQSASLGYCDVGSDSNAMLQELRAQREATRSCNAKLITVGPDAGSENPHSRLVDGVICPLEPISPIPSPDACTPCPKRATCDGRKVICNGAFILQAHPMAKIIPGAEKIFGGLPGFGSIAFPPQCVEDRRWLQQVGLMEKVLEGWLAKAKGDKICKGLAKSTPDGGDAKAWGVLEDDLRKAAKNALKRRVPVAQVDTMFDDATIKLEEHGLIVSEVDTNGARWIAALRSDMDLVCRGKVTVNEAWEAWRKYLYSLLGLAGLIVYARSRVAANRLEARRVAELVQVSLDSLRAQELGHHTDPVTHPHGYLSSTHLRDLILQDEHSGRARRRIWEKVERVVEGNANVRAGIEELNGEETRAWRWTGSTNSISPRRVQWTGSTKQEDD